MRARLALLAVASVLTASLQGCGGSASRSDGAVDARDARADTGSDGPGGDVAVDGPAGVDQRVDQTGGSDVPADTGGGGDAPADTGSGGDARCTTQTIILARGGTTSSCSFPVPSSVPRDQVNLSIGGRLCQQGSNNCTARGGWFWFGNEVALCDDTCIAWENSGANLILEVGCPSESCFVACHELGGPCGDGINSCCAGWRCSNGTCGTCTRGGQSCTTTAECCS